MYYWMTCMVKQSRALYMRQHIACVGPPSKFQVPRCLPGRSINKERIQLCECQSLPWVLGEMFETERTWKRTVCTDCLSLKGWKLNYWHERFAEEVDCTEKLVANKFFLHVYPWNVEVGGVERAKPLACMSARGLFPLRTKRPWNSSEDDMTQDIGLFLDILQMEVGDWFERPSEWHGKRPSWQPGDEKVKLRCASKLQDIGRLISTTGPRCFLCC